MTSTVRTPKTCSSRSCKSSAVLRNARGLLLGPIKAICTILTNPGLAFWTVTEATFAGSFARAALISRNASSYFCQRPCSSHIQLKRWPNRPGASSRGSTIRRLHVFRIRTRIHHNCRYHRDRGRLGLRLAECSAAHSNRSRSATRTLPGWTGSA